MLIEYKITEKNKLTHDIYEMKFESNTDLSFIYWQFITFILPWIWWRAYSVLNIENNQIITLIIKRVDEWRGWSKFICDSNVWDILKWVWPAWHFTLKQTNNNKLFLWTWTWFVPLYNQIRWSLNLKQDCNLKLVFWLKNSDDIFYENTLNELKSKNNNFDYSYYLSRENDSIHNYWRVTDYLTLENIVQFSEFYICWISQMIDSSIEILTNLWIQKEQIFTEKY